MAVEHFNIDEYNTYDNKYSYWVAHKDAKAEIIQKTQFLDKHFENVDFKQRLYHAINNNYGLVQCKNPRCNKPARYSNSRGYTTCSTSCRIEYTKHLHSLKYGTSNLWELDDFRSKVTESTKTASKKYASARKSKRSQQIRKHIEHLRENGLDGFKEFNFEEFKRHEASYLQSHPRAEAEVLYMTSFLDEKYENIRMSQRLWHIRNSDYTIQKCKGGCGNIAKFTLTKGYVTCSNACRTKVTKSTCLDKYGVEVVSKADIVKAKTSESMTQRYGAKTNLLVQVNPMHMPEVKAKVIENLKKSWTTEKRKQMSEMVNSKSKAELKSMSEAGSLAKYGVKNPMQSDLVKFSIHSRFKDWLYENGYDIVEKGGDVYKVLHSVCGHETTVHYSTIVHRRKHGVEICSHCHPYNLKWSSKEAEVFEYISTLINSEIMRNTRDVIPPQELDIYVPEYNLAIEFNGLYWHSQLYKDRYYHQNKFKACSEFGVRLLQVWEHDWYYRKDIVKSIIANALGKSESVYARKLRVQKLDAKTARPFLDENHLQGYTPATVYYGLFLDDDLYHITSFRKIKGQDWEVSRVANKIGISVKYGFKRCLTNFLRSEHHIDSLITYSDASYFTGSQYEAAGFRREGITKPGYFYFNSIDDIKSRQQCQKKKLVAQGADASLSESEIMAKLGFVKIYGCGSHKFTYLGLNRY